MAKVKIRVLVVEQDDVNAIAARGMLEKLGCFVDVASNGFDAVQRFRDTVYDLILMEWQLPVLDGVEATARIRGTSRGRITPIIGTTVERSRSECLQGGMNDSMPKPFLFDKMRQMLLRWTAWSGIPDPCKV